MFPEKHFDSRLFRLVFALYCVHPFLYLNIRIISCDRDVCGENPLIKRNLTSVRSSGLLGTYRCCAHGGVRTYNRRCSQWWLVCGPRHKCQDLPLKKIEVSATNDAPTPFAIPLTVSLNLIKTVGSFVTFWLNDSNFEINDVWGGCSAFAVRTTDGRRSTEKFVFSRL